MTDRATTVSTAHKTRGEAMMAAIDAIQAELEPGETAKYPPIRVEDHLMAMYRKTYVG